MRKLGIPEIEDIARGAALLGAGGGGDPYLGKLVAIGAINECGPVTLLDPKEVPDDALVVPFAMMGAPTVLCEKIIGGSEYKARRKCFVSEALLRSRTSARSSIPKRCLAHPRGCNPSYTDRFGVYIGARVAGTG